MNEKIAPLPATVGNGRETLTDAYWNNSFQLRIPDDRPSIGEEEVGIKLIPDKHQISLRSVDRIGKEWRINASVSDISTRVMRLNYGSKLGTSSPVRILDFVIVLDEDGRSAKVQGLR